jgi:hypothetical protein
MSQRPGQMASGSECRLRPWSGSGSDKRKTPRAVPSFSSPTARAALRRRGIRAIIPRRRNQRRVGRFDRAAYRERNVVERTINRLKQYRRVATRYEKRAAHYLGMVTIAAIMLWI